MPFARKFALALIALSLLAASPAAADPASMIAKSEKVKLKGRKGEKLTRPGYELGEYSGLFSASTFKGSDSLGIWAKDKTAFDFTITRPGWTSPVTVACGGGQGRLGLGWVTFKRDKLQVTCTFGGSAPANAAFSLALGEGSFLQKLAQPQRAAELQYGAVNLRAQTRVLGGLPLGGGGPVGYLFSKGDDDIGGVQLAGFQPTFYLPPQPSAERDAAAITAMILFLFKDPGRPER